jgi:hypothetical protein
MKTGFASYLLINVIRYLPVAAVWLLFWQAAENPANSRLERILLSVGAVFVAVSIAEGIYLKGRVERLEKLLTSLEPDSAAYRKEIADYDKHPTGSLIILPEGHEQARVTNSIYQDS